MGVGVSGDGPLCGPKKNNNKGIGVRNLSHLILIHQDDIALNYTHVFRMAAISSIV
jgi:hypothetical protein